MMIGKFIAAFMLSFTGSALIYIYLGSNGLIGGMAFLVLCSLVKMVGEE